MTKDEMWDSKPPSVVEDRDGTMWEQARGELLGFANALERGNSGITAAQLRLAIYRADCLGQLQKGT